MPKEWTVAEIKEKVNTEQAWTERAIIVLFNEQTATEQSFESTVECNGRGFNATDAFILSEFARWITRRGHLTPKQLACAQKKVGKYSKQLHRLISEKVEA